MTRPLVSEARAGRDRRSRDSWEPSPTRVRDARGPSAAPRTTAARERRHKDAAMRGAARAAVLLTTCRAFYLPGVAPRTFRYGDKVELKVNKLTSVHTQIPYDYYSLKF